MYKMIIPTAACAGLFVSTVYTDMTLTMALPMQERWQAEADAAQAELDSIGKDEL